LEFRKLFLGHEGLDRNIEGVDVGTELFWVDTKKFTLQLGNLFLQSLSLFDVSVPAIDIIVSDLGTLRLQLLLVCIDTVEEVVVVTLSLDLVLLLIELVLQVLQHIGKVLQIMLPVTGGSGGSLLRLVTKARPESLDLPVILCEVHAVVVVIPLLLLVHLGNALGNASILLLKGVKTLLDVSKFHISGGLVRIKVLLGGKLVVHFLAKVVSELVQAIKELR